jgi:hypothetical protein
VATADANRQVNAKIDMENGHMPHRGSQRALKMLNAQLQKSSNNQSVAAKPAARLSWPSQRPPTSLDPPLESVRPPNPAVKASHAVGQGSSTDQQVRNNAVSTPVANHRELHIYASPEASFPSNGGVVLPLPESRDGLIASRDGFGNSGSTLVNDFNNNSNTGFSVPAVSDVIEVARIASVAPTIDCPAEGRISYSVDSGDETRNSMCFSLCDGKVTSLVATSDGAYCIAAFSTGAIRLFDMTIEGNTDPEDRFGYQIGVIESSRGSVQVRHKIATCTS